MAKRRRVERAQRPRSGDAAAPVERVERAERQRSAEAVTTAVERAPEAPALSAPGWLLTLALGASLLALAIPAPPGHTVVQLFDAGRVLLVIGLGLALAHRLYPTRVTGVLAPYALLIMLLGLGAWLGRHTWELRVFATRHPADFGAPSELAWVALALGLRRIPRRPDRIGWGLVALGLGWGLIALVLPEPGIAGPASALGASFRDPMRALLALALLAALGLAAWAIVAALRRDPAANSGAADTPRAARATPYLAPVLLSLFALSGLASSTPLHALASALFFLAIGVQAEAVLAAHDAAPDRPIARALPWLALAAILVVWLLLKSQALIASNTDENIYFYMAKLLADGKLPYRDYFFAHPPLHVLLPGLAFSLFGFSLTLAKLFPMLATLVSGLAVWGIARRAISPFAAPLALVVFLFASEVLKASSNMTGVNMSAMWLLLGTWQAMKGRLFVAGLLLGAAVTTGFYTMAPALAVIALAFFFHDASRPRSGLRAGLAALAGFLLVAGGINLVFYAIGGDTYLEGVYAYHQQKLFEDPDMVEIFGGSPGFPGSIVHNLGVMIAGRDFTKEIFYHAHLWIAGLALPVVVLASWLRAPERKGLWRMLAPTSLFRSGADGRALALWLVGLALFVQFAMFRELYSFYFVLIYPFLALLLAYVVWRGLDLLVPVAAPAAPVASPRRRLVAAALGLAGVLALGLHAAVSDAEQAVFDDELEVIGSRNDYAWTEPPVLASLAGITKSLFWEGDRLRGGMEPGYRHYLWTKKRGFTVLGEVAAHIRAGSAPDETIAGASTLAPLVALLADRRIAADEIDTNNKRFQIGILSEASYWSEICKDRVRYLVSAPRSYFTQDKLDSLPVVRSQFIKEKVFADPTLQYSAPFEIALYRRTGDAPCQPP